MRQPRPRTRCCLQVLNEGYKAALRAGVPNLGIANWLNRVKLNRQVFHLPPADVSGSPAAGQSSLSRSGPACQAPSEVVGVFIHLDSCAAWHGMQ